MKELKIKRIYKDHKLIFTENHPSSKGIKIYGEKIIKYKNKELRYWNPYRSKLSAAIINGLEESNINFGLKILYLGAATGTTVSHLSDIVKDGVIYSIDNSPIAVKSLINLSKKRPNIIPLLYNANHPETYNNIIQKVDFIYQDISQKNQAEIFIKNIEIYLKKKGYGIIMVKARSIDVSLNPKKAYNLVINKLKEKKIKIIDLIDISKYEKDHAVIVIKL